MALLSRSLATDVVKNISTLDDAQARVIAETVEGVHGGIRVIGA